MFKFTLPLLFSPTFSSLGDEFDLIIWSPFQRRACHAEMCKWRRWAAVQSAHPLKKGTLLCGTSVHLTGPSFLCASIFFLDVSRLSHVALRINNSCSISYKICFWGVWKCTSLSTLNDITGPVVVLLYFYFTSRWIPFTHFPGFRLSEC